MKSVIAFTVLLSSIVFLTGCTKTVIEPQYPPQDPILGSWILAEAAEGTESGWYGFTTGLENGVFRFYGDGAVQYSDAQGNLQGQWYVQTVTGNYYDQYGSYHYGSHETLELHLSDSYSNSTIHLVFDYAGFYGNSFVGTYYNGKYIERYRFSRY